jgi:hypothetical protein
MLSVGKMIVGNFIFLDSTVQVFNSLPIQLNVNNTFNLFRRYSYKKMTEIAVKLNRS